MTDHSPTAGPTTTPASPAAEPTLRSLVLTVYVPTLLFAIGQGAVIPVIALTATDLGASAAVAGVAVAVRGIGTVAFDIPAGRLIERFGERRAMAIGTGVLVVALAGALASPAVWLFFTSIFVLGCGWAMWLLARLTYVSEVMPFHLRGRALSTLGGVNRIGNFLGPFIGAGAIVWLDLAGAYWVHIVLASAGWLVLAVIRDPHRSSSPPAGHAPPPVTRIVREHHKVFLTAGVGATSLSVLRVSRHAIIPLWGAHIGLDPAAISVVFGISSAMDMTLFYPAGMVSDRYGRKAIAVPCLSVLALGFLLVPLTSTFWTLAGAGLVMGFGNGMGSGIVMTLGADFSPAVGRASFLGVWRLVSDAGQAGGPLIAAGITALAGLGPASLAIGMLGMGGATMFLFAMPEPAHQATTMEPRSGTTS
ncbi:MAG: MFS transporter [Acidimicrobiales bacterium]